ncbi:threonine/serine exporter family protein, partial [Mycolicibacterium elephantis]
QMMAAIATALALGSGVVLGEFLGSPLRYRAGRIGDLVRKEGLPGLRRAIGPVVHLRPTEAAQTTSTHHPQSRSVALEPTPADEESRADGGDESESPDGQVDRRDGQRDEQ